MSLSYVVGFVTPFVLVALGLVVMDRVEKYRNARIGFEHKGCGGWHEFRDWLPKPLLRRVAMPVSVWRCNRGKPVKLMEWHSQGREYSNLRYTP